MKYQALLSSKKKIQMLFAAVALFVLGFNDTSTLVGHFVSSPREREKRDSVLGFNDMSTLVGHFV